LKSFESISLGEIEEGYRSSDYSNLVHHIESSGRNSEDLGLFLTDLVDLLPEAQAFFQAASEILHSVQSGDDPATILRRIDQFNLIRELGQGGMGTVYLAQDTHLQRRVALKLIPFSDEFSRKEFLRESRAIGAIEHKNVCQVHSAGFADQDTGFIVMPFYEGTSVRRMIEEGVLTNHLCTEIVEQCAEGLSAAHNAGIVHRDIKPDNLIYDEQGIVRIIDFGIAHLENHALTSDHQGLKGTIPYMSPELFRGEPASTASDFWSLGVSLFEMLTGELPFFGPTPEATMRSILDSPYIESELIPADLSHVLNKCLSKRPLDRYQDGSDLLKDLLVSTSALEAYESRKILITTLILVLAATVWGLASQWSDSSNPLSSSEASMPQAAWPSLSKTADGYFAVFPFSISQSDSLSEAGDIVASQLSTRLEGLRGLTARSSATSGLEPIHLSISGRIDLSDSQRILHAQLRDSLNNMLSTEMVILESEESLIEGVDELALRIISQFVEDGGTSTENYEAIRNVSFEALKEFMIGQHWAIVGRDETEYITQFQRAVDIDSTFALGWQQLAIATDHTPQHRYEFLDPREVIEKAFELKDALPAFLSNNIVIDRLVMNGEYESAQPLLEDLVARYPRHRNAWVRMANFQYHFNYRLGGLWTDALDSYMTAYRLDPSNTYQISELAFMLAIGGQLDLFQDLAPTLLTQRAPEFTQGHILGAQLASENLGERDEAIRLAIAGGQDIFQPLSAWPLVFLGDSDLSLQLYEMSGAITEDDERQAMFQSLIRLTRFSRGERSEALSSYVAFDKLGGTSLTSGVIARTPYEDIEADVSEFLIEQWNTKTPSWVSDQPDEPLLGRNAAPIATFSLGLLALQSGEDVGSYTSSLREQAVSSTDPEFVESLISRLLAETAFRNQDYETAQELFEQAEWFRDGYTQGRNLLTMVPERMRRSEALVKLGRLDEALYLLDTIGNGMFDTEAEMRAVVPNRGFINLARAEISMMKNMRFAAQRHFDNARSTLTMPDSLTASRLAAVGEELAAQ